MGLFILFCPIVGPCYLALSETCYRILFSRKRGEVNVDELSFHKDRVEILVPADVEGSQNKVPIGDALLASNKSNARKVMLDVLKTDYDLFLSEIATAVEHTDSEVSHYAASAISDIISEFKKQERKLLEHFGDTKDMKTAEEYSNFVCSFLEKNILPESEQKIYLVNLESLLKGMFIQKEFELIYEYYERLMILLMEQGWDDKINEWINLAKEQSLNELGIYKALMNYYYHIKDRDRLLETLNRLKASNVELDSETLDFIRYIRV